ncbi:MAG: thioredoxin domain-containing protein [Verrucomicrobiae bacterium]|nr:thioredoxin domain-containing protein [Verrucomicrobiae bacterium]
MSSSSATSPATSSPPATANRLAREKSPYLLQHAHNPVDWYPWGPEAFEKAKRENKPILVSIGYSTCHWCHVMEKESFESPATAEVMNRHFVNIKVDREERPDVDAIYMAAAQAQTGSGGWPLNAFLTPDLKPFYAGTYFPPEPRYGRPSWTQLLERIHQLWTERAADLRESADKLAGALAEYSKLEPAKAALIPEIIEQCAGHFEAEYDSENGGFGSAPKFPRPPVLHFLTRYAVKSRKDSALNEVAHTLRQMARGGIYDQLGGGFARYSVDAVWLVPHFEKMLYDNGQLAATLAEVHQLTGDDFFAGVAHETLAYVKRDLMHPGGGFYCAEDADSEGVEGKFYVWTRSEIRAALPAEEAKVFEDFFGVTEDGNFEEGGMRANILHQTSSLPEVAARHGLSEDRTAELLQSASEKLMAIRARRVRPHRDDKILASWNGLMISGFAKVARALADPSIAEPAVQTARFLEKNFWDGSARKLRHRWRDGHSDAAAFQVDSAFFIQGLLDLYEADFQPEWLERAIRLQEAELEHFWSEEDGGFFSTPAGQPDLLYRSFDDTDNAEPSGNSVAASNLLRLSRLTERPEWEKKANRIFELFGDRLRRVPFALPQMVAAYLASRQAPAHLAILGTPNEPRGGKLLEAAQRLFLPFHSVVLINEETRPRLAKLHPFFGTLQAAAGKPTAYLCENFSCKLPIHNPEELLQALEGGPELGGA